MLNLIAPRLTVSVGNQLYLLSEFSGEGQLQPADEASREDSRFLTTDPSLHSLEQVRLQREASLPLLTGKTVSHSSPSALFGSPLRASSMTQGQKAMF